MLANAVRVTLGPRGRHVLLARGREHPRFTKDGVTVALEIQVSDRFENMGAELVRQVASLTAAAAGDGTSTAIVLAQAICRAGVRLLAAGHHPLELRRGLDHALKVVQAELRALSRPVSSNEDLQRVATLAANGDAALGALVAAALEQVGLDGIVSVVEGNHVDTTTEVVHGLQFERGFLSPYFVTDSARVECVLEDAWVLLADQPVRSPSQLVPVMEAAVETKKPLLIIAESVSEEALATLVVNKLRGNLTCCAVKCPSLGQSRLETLRDLAAVTGGTIISPESGQVLERVVVEQLGRCQRIVVNPELTTLVGGHGDRQEVTRRVAQLRQELERSKADKRAAEHAQRELEQRLNRLAQGVAFVRVGGRSDSELRERKDRVEDAVCATRLALEQGVVPGGGVALIRCQAALESLSDDVKAQPGVRMLHGALAEPLRRIAQNAGEDAAIVVETVRAGQGPFGYDAARREYTDLAAAGVLDATQVVHQALECAVNVTGLLLTTQAMLADRHPRPRTFNPHRPDLFDDEDDDY